jgi:hypothetical protein
MSNSNVETVFIVGAGFSHHAGLPLANEFTEGILEARKFSGGSSRTLVDFLSRFVQDAFDRSTKAGARSWPNLEDIFTCVDLSANSGHHLGASFAPADLRTARRAMLSRIIRMLDEKYDAARKRKKPEWRRLDDFFWAIRGRSVGFISMNWDTVIERKVALAFQDVLLDYRCDALPAIIPEPPDEVYEPKEYAHAMKNGVVITVAPLPADRRKVDASLPIVKTHGSANWLYCDNCRQLFWFDPGQSARIADQLIRKDDLVRIGRFLSKKQLRRSMSIFGLHPQVNCICSDKVALGTRIATFSYRKALDFPMFQKSWFAAEELLGGANKWVFIGYSLPAADYEFKYLLKRTQLSRRKQPEFIVVSGGAKDEVRRSYENYRKFFGRSIDELSFFPRGLTHEAVAAICR